MKYFKDFRKLCTPASVYLFINVIIFISIAIQNFGNTRHYCVGKYTCNVPNTFSMFLFKALYILFWTFILNAICKAGYKEVSWFMVLLPIILLFILIGMVMLNSKSVRLYEGFKEGYDPHPAEDTPEPTYKAKKKGNNTIKDSNVTNDSNKHHQNNQETHGKDEDSSDDNEGDDNGGGAPPEGFRNMFR